MDYFSSFLPITNLGVIISNPFYSFPKNCDNYIMIESIDIKNFRCFDEVKISNLTRINVIAGGNASGKTAFFEAIYLASNATGLALQNIRTLRLPSHPSPVMVGLPGGLPISLQQNSPPNFDALFRTTKIDNKISRADKISISFRDSKHDYFEVAAFFQNPGSGQLLPVINIPGASGTAPPLMLHREKKDESGNLLELSDIPVSVNQFGQLQQPFATPFGPVTYLFGSGMDYSESDNVAWFSELKEKNEADTVIAFIKKEFPFIDDIEVLAPPPGNNGLYATMSDGSRRRITSISSGIYKIISILLACAHARDGIIIIDEIENGIFYEKYSAVWDILYKFSVETGNQIFVSTHSLECLNAILSVIEGKESDFSLLRTESAADVYNIAHVSGQSMKAALTLGSEIRS